MQLQFRIDENNYVTFSFSLAAASPNSPGAQPEIIAATVTESKLDSISDDGLLDLAGQLVDWFSADQSAPGPAPDWRSEFLAATGSKD